MQLIQYPARKDWKQILQRPYHDNRQVHEAVERIMNAVKERGDEAIRMTWLLKPCLAWNAEGDHCQLKKWDCMYREERLRFFQLY